MLTTLSTQVWWGLRTGMWVFGADAFADLIRKVRDYTLDGIAHQIAGSPRVRALATSSRTNSRRGVRMSWLSPADSDIEPAADGLGRGSAAKTTK